MTTTTDLTPERLAELLNWAERHPVDFVAEPTGSKKAAIVPLDEYRIIIAMAKRTEAEERENATFKAEIAKIGDLTKDIAASSSILQFALEQAERERDALRQALEYIVCDWDDCACDGDYEQLGRDVGEDARHALAALAQFTDAGGV